MARYRKGVKICELGGINKIAFADYITESVRLAVIDTFTIAFTVDTSELPLENRTTKGKTLKNENKKRFPDKVFRVY